MTNISFNDVNLKEQYSEQCHRSDIDISVNMGKFSLLLPIFSANMPQITETSMAVCMYKNGGRGIIHRFCSIYDNIKMFKEVMDKLKTDDPYAVGVSIGVQKDDQDRFIQLYREGARLFCIDVAHGHHILVKNMMRWIKGENGNFHKDVCLIVGNVATTEGARDLAEWGADIEKIGIGGGSVCATRKNTGVGTPQFTAIQNAKKGLEKYPNVKIIADGGIKNAGDIPKAFAAGADAVMVGAVLAGTTETPGRVYPCPDTDLWNRQYYKIYGGSASGENKVSNGKEHKFVEGVMKTVPFKGKAKYILSEIIDGLKSSYSYSGASNSEEFKRKVKFEIMSSEGKEESKL